MFFSSVLLTESNPSWTIDSGVIDHVAGDRSSFMEYRRTPCGTKCIYVENNTRVEIKGIGTCKLCMRDSQILYLYDVLFAPEIQQNLVSVPVLLNYVFAMYFHDTMFELFLNSIYYGCGNL